MPETVCSPSTPWRRAFVLGGARSGKSALAERLARDTGLPRVYVATAQAFDAEMAERIARHREDRGPGWTTVEAPLALPEALDAADRPDGVVLVDCLTLWLSNLMLDGRDAEGEGARLVARLGAARGRVVLVSNEVGLGIVPDTPLGRRFRDAQGRLNQRVAAACDAVAFVAAGLPLWLKGGP
jgi:adenosylcobinamide kinase/adenosylcobinamide-phosphate guanylyltransferase